jgi:hypothetical protein
MGQRRDAKAISSPISAILIAVGVIFIQENGEGPRVQLRKAASTDAP